MADKTVKINRAPVMTLWATVVAERMGYQPEEALTLGQAVASMNAYSKGRNLGIYEEKSEEEEKEEKQREEKENGTFVKVLSRNVPAVKTPEGLRATDEGRPINPASVQRYLHGKFGNDYNDVRKAMQDLAESYSPDELKKKAYSLYEKFRPEVPQGTRGWGARGELDLHKIRSLENK